MSQFWTLSSYFMLDRCNLSTTLFTLAQLSPVDQIQRTNLATMMGSIATILGCLQASQADLCSAAANSPPLIRQQNIWLVKFELQSSLLTMVKRGLPAIMSDDNFLLSPDAVLGRASFSLANFERRRY